jgi:chaperonin GroEL
MTNKMVFANNEELRQKIVKGANTLADYVSSTLGPKGRTVLLKEQDKPAFATKDGVTVAQFVQLDDEFENAGAQVIRQAANETNTLLAMGQPLPLCWREQYLMSRRSTSLLASLQSNYKGG